MSGEALRMEEASELCSGDRMAGNGRWGFLEVKIQVRGFFVLNNLIYSMLSLVPNIESNAVTNIRVSLQFCCYFGKLTATGSHNLRSHAPGSLNCG
jgi:hypothetical protein